MHLNEHFKNKTKKTIPFTKASKRILRRKNEYLGTNLTKEMQNCTVKTTKYC